MNDTPENLENQPQQLSLFQDEFNPFDDIRQASTDGQTLYSLVDVCAHFADVQSPRYYWRDLKRKLKRDGFQRWAEISQLKMVAQDGKMRLTDCTDGQTLFRILQSISHPRVEPFKMKLAELGYGVATGQIEAIEWDSLSVEDAYRISARADGVATRMKFTAAQIGRAHV